jgi:hypothetical protein
MWELHEQGGVAFYVQALFDKGDGVMKFKELHQNFFTETN